ncbi:MAG: hypothetical protein AB3N64_10370 [Puniceicoccaceae bacterium]
MNILPANSLRRLTALILAGFLLAGCETDNASTGDGGGSMLVRSLPMDALDAMFISRSALISLAEGSAEDPQLAFARVDAAMADLRLFSERLTALSRSFNDADYLYFWDTLAGFGSIYMINTGSLTANTLRNLELRLRSFENSVHVLNRVFGDYLAQMQDLRQALGPEPTMNGVQQRIPEVNGITAKTVELEVLIKDFSEDLFQISRFLQNAQTGF